MGGPLLVTVIVSAPTSAPSDAVTVITLVPTASGIPTIDQLVVPVAMPLPPRSLLHVTLVTVTSSLAVPPRLIVEALVVNVGFAVGDAIDTVGGAFLVT